MFQQFCVLYIFYAVLKMIFHELCNLRWCNPCFLELSFGGLVSVTHFSWILVFSDDAKFVMSGFLVCWMTKHVRAYFTVAVCSTKCIRLWKFQTIASFFSKYIFFSQYFFFLQFFEVNFSSAGISIIHFQRFL